MATKKAESLAIPAEPVAAVAEPVAKVEAVAPRPAVTVRQDGDGKRQTISRPNEGSIIYEVVK